jgi:hypothetical protein
MVLEWEHKLLDQRFGEPPIDILVLNDGNKIIMVKYERYANFVYNDRIKDYVHNYTPAIEYLTTYNYLMRNNKHALFME